MGFILIIQFWMAPISFFTNAFFRYFFKTMLYIDAKMILTQISAGGCDFELGRYSLDRKAAEKHINYLCQFIPENKIPKVHNDVDDKQCIVASLSHWCSLALMMKSIENIPGVESLKKQFISQYQGYMNQLLATIYLKHFSSAVEVLGIEQQRESLDIDIVAKINGEDFFFHVKTADQVAKRHMQFEISCQIDRRLWKNPIKNDRGQNIVLKNLNGIVPRLLTEEELTNIFSRLPQEMEQSISVKQYDSKHKKDVDHRVVLFFDWGVGHGEFGGIDLLKNLPYHIEEIEKKIVSPHNVSGPKNIVIAVMRYPASEVLSCPVWLDLEKIDGIFFLSASFSSSGSLKLRCERSGFFLREKRDRDQFESLFPQIIDLPLMET